jgi:hypothetical protein
MPVYTSSSAQKMYVERFENELLSANYCQDRIQDVEDRADRFAVNVPPHLEKSWHFDGLLEHHNKSVEIRSCYEVKHFGIDLGTYSSLQLEKRLKLALQNELEWALRNGLRESGIMQYLLIIQPFFSPSNLGTLP